MEQFVNEKSDPRSFQFYPTPAALADRAWAKFKNRDFVRVLEPSAGGGHLARANPRYSDRGTWRGPQIAVDCIEIDVSKHPLLREQGFNVVGVDFGQFNGAGAIYSHIIMNPPFLEGAKHVLKAWDVMYDGEIVAIINAETILNPFSKERRLLVQLIDQAGEVEFLKGAFAGPDAERTTDVDVALVYLRKQSQFSKDLLGDILAGLDREQRHHGLDAGYQEANDLALPDTFVVNSVKSFEAAVQAMRQSVFAEARSAGYAARLGKSMEQLAAENGEADISNTTNSSLSWVQGEMHKRYSDLKARAWTGILRSTQVLSKLSSAAQKRVESEFENIKQLEFSVSNVYGFLGGLIAKQADIQLDMACDVFDMITRYHSDNTVFYMGWKSNDKHRTCGMSIKSTRFVLPGHKTDSYQRNISWDSERMLADFDKVFALLDGKAAPELGLVELFKNNFATLRVRNTRMSSTYFDVRYYPGAGTIHFFPRDKKLMGRLNRLVGAHRKWLPPAGERVSDAFWLQYESAEKFDRDVREKVMKEAPRFGCNAMDKATSNNAENRDEGMAKVAEALVQVLANNGIDPNSLLEAGPAVPALEDKARLAA